MKCDRCGQQTIQQVTQWMCEECSNKCGQTALTYSPSLPTQSGWYWVKDIRNNGSILTEEPKFIECFPDGCISLRGEIIQKPLGTRRLFAGPLPRPGEGK